jgi:hypothetical protein
MKKLDLRKLIARYQEIQAKIKKSHNETLKKELEEIEHRYFHETGNNLESELQEKLT